MTQGGRRIHARVPLQVAVSLASDHNFYTGITNDISEGGLFVATYMPPPRGTFVDVELTLPYSDQPFRVTGIVRWIRELDACCDGMPPGCGIEWLDVEPAVMVVIGQFITERDTLLYECA